MNVKLLPIVHRNIIFFQNFFSRTLRHAPNFGCIFKNSYCAQTLVNLSMHKSSPNLPFSNRSWSELSNDTQHDQLVCMLQCAQAMHTRPENRVACMLVLSTFNVYTVKKSNMVEKYTSKPFYSCE